MLAWWWSEGEGKFAVLFFASGFAVFALLFSTWAMAWSQIMWGKPVQYVFLGPSLRTDKDYYYAADDLTKIPAWRRQ